MNTQDSFPDQNNDSTDIVKELRYYLFFWPWFLLSVLVFVFGAYFYLRYADTIIKLQPRCRSRILPLTPLHF